MVLYKWFTNQGGAENRHTHMPSVCSGYSMCHFSAPLSHIDRFLWKMWHVSGVIVCVQYGWKCSAQQKNVELSHAFDCSVCNMLTTSETRYTVLTRADCQQRNKFKIDADKNTLSVFVCDKWRCGINAIWHNEVHEHYSLYPCFLIFFHASGHHLNASAQATYSAFFF